MDISFKEHVLMILSCLRRLTMVINTIPTNGKEGGGGGEGILSLQLEIRYRMLQLQLIKLHTYSQQHIHNRTRTIYYSREKMSVAPAKPEKSTVHEIMHDKVFDKYTFISIQAPNPNNQ